MQLTEFLTARLDEDEAAARSSIDMPDRHLYGCTRKRLEPGDSERLLLHGGNLLVSPTRVLAEVEAKRRMFALWAVPDLHDNSDGCESCDAFRLLALPFADHPDYDEAWRA